MAMFSGQDTIAKTLSSNLAPIQIAWVRYAFNVVLLTPLLLVTRFQVLTTRRPVTQFLRGALLAVSAAFFIGGLRYLPIADTTAISFVYPLLVTLLASLALKETIGLSRWLAVFAGFLGALIIIRPGAADVGSAALLPLASATCWSGGLLLTRRLSIDAALTTLVYSTLSAALLLTVGLTMGWRPIAPEPGRNPLLCSAHEYDWAVWVDSRLLEASRFLPRAVGVYAAHLVNNLRFPFLFDNAHLQHLAWRLHRRVQRHLCVGDPIRKKAEKPGHD